MTEKENKGKKKGKKVGIIITVVVILVLAVVSIGGYAVFHHYYGLLDYQNLANGQDSGTGSLYDENEEYVDGVNPATDDEINMTEEELRKNLEQMEANSDLYATDAFNVMLIGVDSRSDSLIGRSDAMILCSINKKTKQITMTSFLRDIYLSIPGHGSNRLNAAYAYGESDLLKKTIKANFGITVDRCVVVNFYLVMDLVDAVGGVDLDVSAAEIKVMNSYINSHNKLLGNATGTDILSESQAGKIHANGNQALAYSRVRYVGTDFARTGRQRTVINECLNKIKTMNLKEINKLANKFLPRVRTDLTESDCATLLLMMLNLSDYQNQSMTIPMDGTWNNTNIRGMSVLTIDFSANARAWHDLVDGTSQN